MIEHLRGTDNFLRESARVVRPGGTVVHSTNNLASWHNVFALVLGWQPLPAHVSDEIILGNPANPYGGSEAPVEGQTHLRIFTGRALADLAEHHGLDVQGGQGRRLLPVSAAGGSTARPHRPPPRRVPRPHRHPASARVGGEDPLERLLQGQPSLVPRGTSRLWKPGAPARHREPEGSPAPAHPVPPTRR